MSDTVSSADRSRYRSFVHSQIQLIGKPPPAILWHYTNGNALIEIVKTGSLFSTQISCVNDTTEYIYSVNMLHAAFKRLRPSVAGQPDAVFLLDYIDSNISTDTSTSEWFVTCFSQNRDDLSQWRAYGNGENGYSIGFNCWGITANVLHNKCLLAPVQYDPAIHMRITDAVAHATLQFFLDGWQARRSLGITIAEWTLSFLTAWVDDITYLAPAIKHPGFEPECEWRIIHRLQPDEIDRMVYLQRQTLMSRHLPLVYRPLDAPPDSKLLPIDEIMVGPSRHKQVSKISVADLLRTNGYPEAKRNVTTSDIPFQQV